ncbi:hypothetical protein GCM10023170_013840 [Phytohabitans houttuyneae]|uniref:Uncharacterized protein n=1 Tax=Phytohabitans houttuyneae TaxID=1076126 RepID=A0A6V8KV84_9ACTN|nr:hypothetical protein Phou_103790 [Phytohabitans houttuyneae]
MLRPASDPAANQHSVSPLGLRADTRLQAPLPLELAAPAATVAGLATTAGRAATTGGDDCGSGGDDCGPGGHAGRPGGDGRGTGGDVAVRRHARGIKGAQLWKGA